MLDFAVHACLLQDWSDNSVGYHCSEAWSAREKYCANKDAPPAQEPDSGTFNKLDRCSK